MNLSIDPIRPYLPLIYLGLVLSLVLGGCQWGKTIERKDSAETIAKLRGDLNVSSTRLLAAYESLKASSGALKAQNKANAERVAEAARVSKLSDAARDVAEDQAKAMRKQVAGYQAALDKAARKSPDCEALFRTDLLKVCGL